MYSRVFFRSKRNAIRIPEARVFKVVRQPEPLSLQPAILSEWQKSVGWGVRSTTRPQRVASAGDAPRSLSNATTATWVDTGRFNGTWPFCRVFRDPTTSQEKPQCPLFDSRTRREMSLMSHSRGVAQVLSECGHRRRLSRDQSQGGASRERRSGKKSPGLK